MKQANSGRLCTTTLHISTVLEKVAQEKEGLGKAGIMRDASLISRLPETHVSYQHLAYVVRFKQAYITYVCYC